MIELYYLTICTLGESPNLEICLQKLLDIKANTKENVEILLVLNTEEGHKIFDSRIIVRYEGIKGYSSVRNKAISEVPQNANLIFLDDDEIPTESWFNALVNKHREYPDDVIFGPVLPELGSEPSSYRNQFKKEYESLTDNSIVRQAGVGNMLIPSSLLHRGLVKFDPFYNSSGSEDTDLSFRLRKQGVKIRFAKQAIIYEKQGNERHQNYYLESRYIKDIANYSVVIRRNSKLTRKIWRFSTLTLRILFYTLISTVNSKFLLQRRAYITSMRAFVAGELIN